jgi:uncharacterized protein YneF (UPF0154 family)
MKDIDKPYINEMIKDILVIVGIKPSNKNTQVIVNAIIKLKEIGDAEYGDTKQKTC